MGEFVRVEPDSGDSIWEGILDRPAMILDLDFGVDLLRSVLRDPQGISMWNSWVSSMYHRNLLLPSGSRDDPDPLVMIGLDFSGGDLRGLKLDGIDLAWVWLERVDFSGSSLKGARIGFSPEAIFRDADLTNARLLGDIGGANFSGALVAGVHIGSCCSYGIGAPPVGITPELLSRCRQWPNDPTEAACSPVGRPVKVRGMVIMSPGRRAT